MNIEEAQEQINKLQSWVTELKRRPKPRYGQIFRDTKENLYMSTCLDDYEYVCVRGESVGHVLVEYDAANNEEFGFTYVGEAADLLKGI